MEDKIKVLLVDDEKLERVLIRKGFPWEEKGFEIVGEAESAAEAMEFMQHKTPQIVLTDISMPGVTGLELAEQISKKYPECHIVIVTGFREFEYARKAVEIGVEDFLLKPVNIDDIDKVTEKIKKKIKKENEKKGEVEKLRKSLSAKQDVLIESFLNQLVENRIAEDKAIQKLNVYGFESLMMGCCCFNISIKEDKGQIELTDSHKRVLSYLEDIMPEDAVIFPHYMHNIIVLLPQENEKIIDDLSSKVCEDILIGNIDVTIGVSDVSYELAGISKAYQQSKKALSASVLLGQNRVITYKEYLNVMNKAKTAQGFPWEDFTFAIANVLTDKVEMLLNEYFVILEKAGDTDIEYLRLLTMDILSKAGTTLSKHGADLFQLVGEEQLFCDIRMIQNINESKELIRKNIAVVLEYNSRKKAKHSNPVVTKSLAYIDENFRDPELTLKTAAENVYSNESYLSRVFKKEVGNSFIEYVTKKRIDESIRLLNTTDLKVYEIAEKVGFRDPHYFSICFKKQVGVTVKDFRRKN